MRKRQIDLFFRELDREIGLRAQVILIGASAGSLMGHIRPSVDIDFEIRPDGKLDTNARARLDEAIRKVSLKVGVAVNYSDDIGHWSMVSYLDYRRTATLYKKIGRLSVKLTAPEYWTIGKMTRFLELDIQDMIKIIKIKKIPLDKLVKVWARALKASDHSLELGQFRQHVEFFLKKYGRRLWGKQFDAEAAVRLFRKYHFDAGPRHWT